MTKQNNLFYWIAGIIILFIVLTQLPLPRFPFALVTTVTCASGVTNYYPLDGTFVDMKGGSDITNNGASFITGKLGSGALEFNNTDSISFPTLPLNLSVGFWINNYSNEEGWIYETYNNTSILSSTTFLGLIGSVDEIVIGENILGFPNIQPCYLTTYEENITCRDYATEQVISQSTGCLNYSGTFFPDCNYEWLTTSGYYLSENECNKRFYCANILTSDFSTLALCQAELTEIINETIVTNGEEIFATTPPPTFPPLTIQETLSEDLFKIGTFGIKLWYVIILIVGVLILYFEGSGKK